MKKTYLGDLLADWLYPLQSLGADVGHLLGNLVLLLPLEFLLGHLLLWHLLNDVLKESALSDLVAIVVNDIAAVVNLAASTVAKFTGSETTHDVSFLITDLTLLVDPTARHGVDSVLLLLWLPALALSDDVSVLVKNITRLVNVVGHKLLNITLSDTTDNIAGRSDNVALLVDLGTVETSERSLGRSVLTVDELGTSNDVSRVVPDLTLAVGLLANHACNLAVNDTTNDGAVGIDDVTSLVDSAAGQGGEVLLLGLLL